MLLSIIIPTYNSEATLKSCLESVISFKYKHKHNIIEVLVIDGDSTDDTKSIISEYFNDIATYISEKDSGIYDAMNKGLKHANGHWVYFLGSDDLLIDSTEWLEIIELLNLGIKLRTKVIAGSVIYTDNKLFASYINNDIYYKNTIHHQSAFYDRKMLLEMGGFDINFKLLGDLKINQEIFLTDNNELLVNDVIFIAHFIALCGEQGVSKTLKSLLRKERRRLIRNWPLYILKKIKNQL